MPANPLAAYLPETAAATPSPTPRKNPLGAYLPPAAETEPSMTMGEMGAQAFENLGPSAKQFAQDVLRVVTHPVETAEGLGKTIIGAGQKLKDALGVDPLYTFGDQRESAEAVGEFFADRYGGTEELKNTIATDPVGFAADAATVLTGGGGALARAPATAGRLGRVASVAGKAVDPTQLAVAAGKATGRAVGTAASAIPGMTTGAGTKAIKTAVTSGVAGGDLGRKFREAMRGNVPMEEVVNDARSALSNMYVRRGQQYREGLAKAFKGQDPAVSAEGILQGTRVLDSKGNALKVFHGTNAQFGSFRTGQPVFFSDDARIAGAFAGRRGSGQPNVRPAYLNVRNPLVIDAGGADFKNIPNSAIPDEALRSRLPSASLPYPDVATSDLIDIERMIHASPGGYDGIIVKNVRGGPVDRPSTVYAVLDPKQAVSQFSDDLVRKAPEEILDFEKVDRALEDIAKVKTYKGVPISRSTEGVRTRIRDIIDQWRDLDPAKYHTVEGFDAFKQAIGDVMDGTQYGTPDWRVANEAYQAVKRTIVYQAPEYAKVMKNYEEGTKLLKEIQGELSLGKGKNAATALRKLQAIIRDDVSSAYGRRAELGAELETAGATGLTETLAGHSMSSVLPRGMRGALSAVGSGVTAGVNPAALPLAAASALASSPRLVGEIAHAGGRVAGPVVRGARSLPGIPTGTLPAAYQAGRASGVATGDPAMAGNGEIQRAEQILSEYPDAQQASDGSFVVWRNGRWNRVVE